MRVITESCILSYLVGHHVIGMEDTVFVHSRKFISDVNFGGQCRERLVVKSLAYDQWQCRSAALPNSVSLFPQRCGFWTSFLHSPMFRARQRTIAPH